TFLRLHDIVTLVLGIMQSKIIAGILGSRMYLKAEIPALDSIQKIKTNRKIFSKTGLHRFAQYLDTPRIDEVHGRHLKYNIIHIKKQTILLRHTIKAPAVVHLSRIKCKFSFHPLASPWCRVKEWHNAERRSRRFVHAGIKCLPV